MITVSLIEDDHLLRTTLVRELNASGECQVVSASLSAEAGRELLLEKTPQVALVDIHLPGMSGVALVAELAEKLPETAFVMLTSAREDETIFDALKAGAVGYLTKDSDVPAILAAIADAQRGGSPMSWGIARRVVRSFSQPEAQRGRAAELAKLSPRETEVLAALAQGLPYKQIAAKLELSEHTVRIHIRGIYRKLSVNSRTEAVVKYLGR